MKSGRAAAHLRCSVRNIAGRADSCATAMCAGLVFFNPAAWIHEALTIAGAAFMCAVAFGAFPRSVFFEVQYPLHLYLIILPQNGQFITLTPSPSNGIEVKAQVFSRLHFLVPKIERLLSIFVEYGYIHLLGKHKVIVFQSK